MPKQRKSETVNLQYRNFVVKREHIDEAARTVTLAFSSETDQVERWFGIEILDHGPGSVRLGRLKNAAPLLMDHNTRDQIGVVVSVSIDADRVGRAVVRFGKSSRADEIFQDVIDGIRSKVSVGYDTYERLETDEGTENKPVYRVTDWEPGELSIVSIAADDDVGIGRSGEKVIPLKQQRDNIMDPEEQVAADKAARAAAKIIADKAIRDQDIVTNQARETVRTEELARIHEIRSIGARRDANDLAKTFIDGGQSVDEFRAAVLDKMSDATTPAPTRHAGVDMSDNEHGRYSVVRALGAAADGDWSEAGFEREISQEIGKQLGRTTTGLFIPTNLRSSGELSQRMVAHGGHRALTAGVNSEGGYTVPTNIGALIDLLRNRLMVREMGATVLAGLEGAFAMPKLISGSAFSWVAENPGSDLGDSDAVFGTVPLSPKLGMSTTAFSRLMLNQSSLDIEALVRMDLIKSGATGVDLAAIAGTGSSNQPTGILNTSGIGAVAGGTDGAAPTLAHITDLETEVAVDNADIGSTGYLTNSKVRGKLKQTEEFSGSGNKIWQKGDMPGFGELNGYRAGVSNQVPFDLTKGSADSICSAIIFGNWADLVIGEWGAMELILDPYTSKKQGLIEVTSHLMTNIAIRHAESFASMEDVLTN
jgi:HK97 family phage major capsid protein